MNGPHFPPYDYFLRTFKSRPLLLLVVVCLRYTYVEVKLYSVEKNDQFHTFHLWLIFQKRLSKQSWNCLSVGICSPKKVYNYCLLTLRNIFYWSHTKTNDVPTIASSFTLFTVLLHSKEPAAAAYSYGFTLCHFTKTLQRCWLKGKRDFFLLGHFFLPRMFGIVTSIAQKSACFLPHNIGRFSWKRGHSVFPSRIRSSFSRMRALPQFCKLCKLHNEKEAPLIQKRSSMSTHNHIKLTTNFLAYQKIDKLFTLLLKVCWILTNSYSSWANLD